MKVQISDFFFFQAEDGIRDATVTGVQTCALPILAGREQPRRQVALVTLHAADLAERMAGDQNAHERFSTSARSASRNGSMCSRRRITFVYRPAATRSSP